MLCALDPEDAPDAPAPVCMALTVSSTASKISDTRISEAAFTNR